MSQSKSCQDTISDRTISRQEIVEELTRAFLAAKNLDCQSAEIWRSLAWRYMEIGANMNFAYCIRRANQCVSTRPIIAD